MKRVELSATEICTLISVSTIELEKRQEKLKGLECRADTLHTYVEYLIGRNESKIAELETLIAKLEGRLIND